MFILSGLFLEDGENLFRDFWSPFSISFLTFSARPNYFWKKGQPPYGPCPTRTPQPGRPYKPRPDPAPAQVGAAPQTLTLTDPRRRRRIRRRRRRPRRPTQPPDAATARRSPAASRPTPLPAGAARRRRRHANRGSRRFSRKTVQFYFKTEMRFLY